MKDPFAPQLEKQAEDSPANLLERGLNWGREQWDGLQGALGNSKRFSNFKDTVTNPDFLLPAGIATAGVGGLAAFLGSRERGRAGENPRTRRRRILRNALIASGLTAGAFGTGAGIHSLGGDFLSNLGGGEREGKTTFSEAFKRDENVPRYGAYAGGALGTIPGYAAFRSELTKPLTKHKRLSWDTIKKKNPKAGKWKRFKRWGDNRVTTPIARSRPVRGSLAALPFPILGSILGDYGARGTQNYARGEGFFHNPQFLQTTGEAIGEALLPPLKYYE